jgi:hypothetical protein
MPSTPNFAIPYASLGDPPHGPLQEKAIADAVDAALLAIQNAAAANLSVVSAKVPRLFGARLASNQGITGLADLTGVTVTFTVAATTSVQISATLDAQTTGGNYCEGVVNIDGVDQAQKMHSESDGIGGPDTSSQCVTVSLAAGSHTIKMRAVQSGGTTTVQAQSTGISVLVLGQ